MSANELNVRHVPVADIYAARIIQKCLGEIVVGITVRRHMQFIDSLCTALSDDFLFPAIQGGLILFVLTIAALDLRCRLHTRSGFNALITRGDKSMAKFYGAYGVLTTVFVTLSVSVDYARSHRVFFVVLDVLLIAYACLLNAWFRSKLIGWTGTLSERENR